MLGVLFIRILFLSKSSIQTFEIQYIAHILLYSISQRYNFESNLQLQSECFKYFFTVFDKSKIQF